MNIVIDGGSTDVHIDCVIMYWVEWFFFQRHRIEHFNHIRVPLS